MTRSECEAKIEEYAALPENWDSYGASPLSAETLASARRVLPIIIDGGLVPIAVVPCAYDGIQFEFQHRNRFCELECNGAGGIAILTGTGVADEMRSWAVAEADLPAEVAKIKQFLEGGC